ncbi:sensor histidine kinase [Marinimicrobium agarilyticum]|uniref:sensor histidine kinase n=1 Tax=Marinimicrobium agarilyticum TaxID=306546 RepID=UPI0004050E69|nr:HAMP domain-containing sensor histidine kinase [Marinimicrobium agarilyticum]
MRPTERSPEQYLQWVRWLLLAVLLVPVVRRGLPLDGPWLWLWAGALGVQLLSFMPWPHREQHRLTLHLLLDILLWNAVVWLTGGASNPFSALLLIPLALAFLTLPPILAAGLLVVSILCQLAQLNAMSDMSEGHAGMSGHFEAMVVGFVIAAVLLAMTLLYLRRQLRQREADLQRLREAQLRDEQLLAVGTAAAQLTHEMATPVQSVRLLLEELDAAPAEVASEQARRARTMMSQQLERIEGLLEDWRMIAEDVRERRLTLLTLEELQASLQKTLAITRPGDRIHWSQPQPLEGLQLRADRTLMPAVLSLLHNALDAGGEVRVCSRVESGHWLLEIDNDGPLSPELQARLGAEFVPSESGFGVGARVSHATLERFGGRVLWSADNAGTRTRLTLPIAEGGS